MELSPLRKDDIVVGKPLPWPVFDSNKKLLLREGFVIETLSQVEKLISQWLVPQPTVDASSTLTQSRKRRSGYEAAKNTAEKQVPLSSLKLNIGESLQMQSLTEQKPERYYVKLIGHIEKRSVMVTTPVVDGSVLLMREGQAFVLRGFSGADTFSFNVNVLRVCNMPFPYLHLSHPAFVQSTAIRQHNRIKANIVVSVSNLTHPELAEKQPAAVVDLSLVARCWTRASSWGSGGYPGYRAACKSRRYGYLPDAKCHGSKCTFRGVRSPAGTDISPRHGVSGNASK